MMGCGPVLWVELFVLLVPVNGAICLLPADGCLGWLFLNNKDMRPGFCGQASGRTIVGEMGWPAAGLRTASLTGTLSKQQH